MKCAIVRGDKHGQKLETIATQWIKHS